MAASTRKVYVVRHGETEWSLSGQHTGVTDIPLTENGRTVARRLRPILAEPSFALVLSSPLSRARKTCELAGLGARVRWSSRRGYGLVEPGRKATSAVSKLYIAPAILTAPLVSSAAMTALRLWISAIVSSTFFRATASTKA